MQQVFHTLNTGAKIPLLGLGAWDMYGREAEEAVRTALQIGYRLVDTAAMYNNEKEVGEGIRSSGIPREEIFLTTKVGNSNQGYEETIRAFDESMTKLGCGYVDLYLVHWPIKATRKSTWLALEKLYAEGKVRAIGVANYLPPFLEELEGYAKVVPAVNQVEFTPYLFLRDLLEMCKSREILLQAYSPLLRGQKFGDPRLQGIARSYERTPSQILLRWAIEHGISTIPKSSNPERLRENAAIFDFSISAEDMQRLDSLHENFRVVEDPMMLW